MYKQALQQVSIDLVGLRMVFFIKFDVTTVNILSDELQ